MYNVCMEIERDFDPETMTRATPEDILRIMDTLWGNGARNQYRIIAPREDDELLDLTQQETTMSTTMTPLEYAKSYAPASRIPESVLTMGGLVELLERIDELKAEVVNLDEGARLLHSLATGGESKLLADWQDTPEIKEANQASDKFNYDAVKETEF
jgi:hypothetical protein